MMDMDSKVFVEEDEMCVDDTMMCVVEDTICVDTTTMCMVDNGVVGNNMSSVQCELDGPA